MKASASPIAQIALPLVSLLRWNNISGANIKHKKAMTSEGSIDRKIQFTSMAPKIMTDRTARIIIRINGYACE
jgi:hypothetical protein